MGEEKGARVGRGCARAARVPRARLPRLNAPSQGNASLSRAHRLFRTMGLHSAYVGPPRPHVVGLLTRKDVTEENAEACLGAKAAAARRAGRLEGGEGLIGVGRAVGGAAV